MSDTNVVLVAVRLVLVVFFLFLFVAGVRLALSRRFPAAWTRPAPPRENQQARRVRIGVGLALVAAGVLILEATSLIPMPFLLSGILLAVGLLVALAALGWFVVSRE